MQQQQSACVTSFKFRNFGQFSITQIKIPGSGSISDMNGTYQREF